MKLSIRAILDIAPSYRGRARRTERQRLAFRDTLSLMRCVGSSPAAAPRALRTRAILDADEADAELITARALDDEEAAEDDLEPGAAIEDPALSGLIGKGGGPSGRIPP